MFSILMPNVDLWHAPPDGHLVRGGFSTHRKPPLAHSKRVPAAKDGSDKNPLGALVCLAWSEQPAAVYFIMLRSSYNDSQVRGCHLPSADWQVVYTALAKGHVRLSPTDMAPWHAPNAGGSHSFEQSTSTSKRACICAPINQLGPNSKLPLVLQSADITWDRE